MRADGILRDVQRFANRSAVVPLNKQEKNLSLACREMETVGKIYAAAIETQRYIRRYSVVFLSSTRPITACSQKHKTFSSLAALICATPPQTCGYYHREGIDGCDEGRADLNGLGSHNL